MRAERTGMIFSADQGPGWMESHAAYPTPVLISPDILRIFMISRDKDNRGNVGYIDVLPDNPSRVIGISQDPCLCPGSLGSFSDRGISIGCINKIDNELWLYYLGWNKSQDVPFRNSIGLAISKNGLGNSFEPMFEGPLLDRSRFDPFTLSYPFVEEPGVDGAFWKMYYGTSRQGGISEENMQHVITSATSNDGMDWAPSGEDEVKLEPGEYGLSRPWILKHSGDKFMFYSIRKKQYKIGFSKLNRKSGKWTRVSNDILGISQNEWDSEASCYPGIIQINQRIYMFYNGNNYGLTGIGVAKLFPHKFCIN